MRPRFRAAGKAAYNYPYISTVLGTISTWCFFLGGARNETFWMFGITMFFAVIEFFTERRKREGSDHRPD